VKDILPVLRVKAGPIDSPAGVTAAARLADLQEPLAPSPVITGPLGDRDSRDGTKGDHRADGTNGPMVLTPSRGPTAVTV